MSEALVSWQCFRQDVLQRWKLNSPVIIAKGAAGLSLKTHVLGSVPTKGGDGLVICSYLGVAFLLKLLSN
jgi:hypothetical protein